MGKTCSFKCNKEQPTSLEATRAIINIFKDWVENNRGWALIQDVQSQKREKAIQRFIYLGAKHYVENNKLDISCEADEGRGPVDIKLSKGADKTLAEIKLSSNSQYLHGYEVQIKEYGKAEQTQNLVYVFIDLGHPIKRKNIMELHQNSIQLGKVCPELFIIDARPKNAATTYDSEF